MPNDLAARALSADDGIQRIDYFDAKLTRPVPNGTVTQTSPTAAPITNHFLAAGVGADVIDPDAKLSYTDEVVGGVEFEVMPHTTFGVRYVYRNIGRVLEDVANCPMVAYEFSAATSSACGTVEYILTNPSTATPINPALLAIAPQFNTVHFDDPVHKYNALEFTLNRRFSDRLVGARPRTGIRAFAATSKASTATTTASRIRASARSTTSRPTIRSIRRSMARRAATSASSDRMASCRSTGRTRSRSTATTCSTWG